MAHAVDDNLINHLSRGVEGLFNLDDLKAKLASGKCLRIKLGMDPTAPDVHLGHSVVLRKMRQFQDLGHRAVLIIGDYTAKIGDPTGRDTTRPILDDESIARNAQTYVNQVSCILDTAAEKLEIRRNSEWLSKLSFADVLRLTGQITVQQMLHRENFAKRMEEGREIMVSEFMYPLMQAYDSVVIQADVELGGTDQTFNNLMGRELMGKHQMARQVVMVMPLLVGLDGKEKMSKSKGNYVGLTEKPSEMFGKLMSIPDGLMPNYFQLLTNLPADRIKSLTDAAVTHPRQAKDVLARAIVETYHNAESAAAASDEFRRRFSEGQLPTEMPVIRLAGSEQSKGFTVVKLIQQAGFASSGSEARRLVEQGAVSLNGEKLSTPNALVQPAEGAVLKVGKLRVGKVSWQ